MHQKYRRWQTQQCVEASISLSWNKSRSIDIDLYLSLNNRISELNWGGTHGWFRDSEPPRRAHIRRWKPRQKRAIVPMPCLQFPEFQSHDRRVKGRPIFHPWMWLYAYCQQGSDPSLMQSRYDGKSPIVLSHPRPSSMKHWMTWPRFPWYESDEVTTDKGTGIAATCSIGGSKKWTQYGYPNYL